MNYVVFGTHVIATSGHIYVYDTEHNELKSWWRNYQFVSLWMLYQQCNLDLWPWPWNFKVKFWNSRIPGMVDWHGKKQMWGNGLLDLTHDLDLRFSQSNFKWPYFRNGRADPLDKERKGVWVGHDVALTMQPWSVTSTMNWHWISGFSRTNVKTVVFEEWIDMKQRGYE